ncbi:flagellar hook-length control protein FliK [Brevundimonas fontaquae]|nr:flagellar hook-length control protein FliK [Brevundimonas fontaquae]
MSTASALLAPAAPVSTGTSAAALGAESADAGLFSSKVADALNASVHGAPVERMTPGRLMGARSLGVIMGQAARAETDTVAPGLTAEMSGTIPVQRGDLETPPAASDAQEIETDKTANDNAAGVAAASPSVVPEQMTPVTPATASSAQSTPVEAPVTEADGSDAGNIETKILRSLTTPQAGASAEQTPAPTPTPFMAEASDVDGAVRAASQRPKDEAKAENASAGTTIKVVAAEPGDLPAQATSIPAPVETKQTAKIAADNDKSAPVEPTMPTVDMKHAAELRAASRPTTEPAAAPAEAAALATAASDAAKTAGQSAPVDATKPVAPSPIAQALTAAQIPATQVQVSVAATAPKPSIIAPAAVAVAVKEAELVEPTEKSAAPDQPKAGGQAEAPKQPSTQAPPPLRGAGPEAANETRNTFAPSIEPKPADAATPSAKVEGDAQPTPPPTKAAEAKPAAVGMSAPATPDTPIASAVPADTQVAQQSAQQPATPAHAPGLSTLSRATLETTAQLAAQIARKLDSRSTRFDMVLTPEDLGRVDVSLEIGKDGQLSARLTFDNPAAAADLKGRADELRRQLQEAGFQVAGDALDFSQRDPSAGGGAFERQQQRNALFAGGSRLAAQADMPIVPAPGAWINHSLTPDRVDLKV